MRVLTGSTSLLMATDETGEGTIHTRCAADTAATVVLSTESVSGKGISQELSPPKGPAYQSASSVSTQSALSI